MCIFFGGGELLGLSAVSLSSYLPSGVCIVTWYLAFVSFVSLSSRGRFPWRCFSCRFGFSRSYVLFLVGVFSFCWRLVIFFGGRFFPGARLMASLLLFPLFLFCDSVVFWRNVWSLWRIAALEFSARRRPLRFVFCPAGIFRWDCFWCLPLSLFCDCLKCQSSACFLFSCSFLVLVGTCR